MSNGWPQFCTEMVKFQTVGRLKIGQIVVIDEICCEKMLLHRKQAISCTKAPIRPHNSSTVAAGWAVMSAILIRVSQYMVMIICWYKCQLLTLHWLTTLHYQLNITHNDEHCTKARTVTLCMSNAFCSRQNMASWPA